jgi:hypothetical protein
MSEKRIVTKQLKYYYDVNELLKDSLDETIAHMNKIKSDLESEQYTNLKFEVSATDTFECYIHGSRLETDFEFEQRLGWEKESRERILKHKQDKLERERKEYERLKKKFEK